MNDIDFIPAAWHADVRSRRHVRSHVAWVIALAAVMGLWLWSHQMRMGAAHAAIDNGRARLDELRRSQAFFDDLLAERAKLAAQAALVRDLDDIASLTVILSELAALLPDGLAVTELNYDVQRPPPVAPPPTTATPTQGAGQPVTATVVARPCAESVLRLTGAARNNLFISAFTARLGGSPLFRDVITDMVRDATFIDRQVRLFELHCRVLPQTGGAR